MMAKVAFPPEELQFMDREENNTQIGCGKTNGEPGEGQPGSSYEQEEEQMASPLQSGKMVGG